MVSGVWCVCHRETHAVVGGQRTKKMCSNLLGQIGCFFIGAVKSFCAENNVFITPIRYSDSLSTKYTLAPQNIVRKAEMVKR